MSDHPMAALYRRDIAHYTERAAHYDSIGNVSAWLRADKQRKKAERNLKELLAREAPR